MLFVGQALGLRRALRVALLQSRPFEKMSFLCKPNKPNRFRHLLPPNRINPLVAPR